MKPVWWLEENKLMKFETINHTNGTIDGSSRAYDEMMAYINIKLESKDNELKSAVLKMCRVAISAAESGVRVHGDHAKIIIEVLRSLQSTARLYVKTL